MKGTVAGRPGSAERLLDGAPQAAEPTHALPDEALDPLHQPFRREVRLVEDLVHPPPGAPTIVPVGGEGVVPGNLVEDPIAHRDQRLGADDCRVGPVRGPENTLPIEFWFSGKK